jgi:hypothetical protein
MERLKEKETKERLNKILARKAYNSAKRFNEEFKKQTLTAITAAFGFLIALTWRTPIQKSVNNLVLKLGLNESATYYEYGAAVIISFLGVLAIMILSKWAAKKNK